MGVAAATGVDCSTLPGVSRVACLAGRCAVSSCATGWDVNTTGDGCVRASALAVQKKRSENALLAVGADLDAVVDIL